MPSGRKTSSGTKTACGQISCLNGLGLKLQPEDLVGIYTYQMFLNPQAHLPNTRPQQLLRSLDLRSVPAACTGYPCNQPGHLELSPVSLWSSSFSGLHFAGAKVGLRGTGRRTLPSDALLCVRWGMAMTGWVEFFVCFSVAEARWC